MNKFLSINFYSYQEAKAFFDNFYGREIMYKDCQMICKKGKYFEQNDSWFLAEKAYNALFKTWDYLCNNYTLPKNFKIPVNSLYRKPFTRLFDGKTDYNDLTTLYSHALGISVDLDFKMFEDDTGLNRNILIDAVSRHGFFFPFIAPENGGEYWHISLLHTSL